MLYVTAQLIGIYPIEFLALLLALILGLIFLLRHLFRMHYKGLWSWASHLWQLIRSLPIIQSLLEKYPALWAFFGRRLSPSGYLGIHLTVGVLLALLAWASFTDIAGGVVEQEELVRFDSTLSTTLYEHATPIEVTAFRIITQLGGPVATILLGVGVGIVLWLYRQRLLLTGWIIAILGNSLLNTILKAFFQRTRPEFSHPFLVEPNWSFPSGHAMGAVVLYGMLAYLIITGVDSAINEFFLMSLVIALVLLIGFSRLYLGVHFFSDVVAGYVAGAGWLAIVISGIEVARRRKQYRLRDE